MGFIPRRKCLIMWRINKIKKYLSDCGAKTLIQALVMSRMDFCNSIYHGLPTKSLIQIQLVQNAAARVITQTTRRDHISPILKLLHCLPMKNRTDYKMMVLAFNALNVCLFVSSYSQGVEYWIKSDINSIIKGEPVSTPLDKDGRDLHDLITHKGHPPTFLFIY